MTPPLNRRDMEARYRLFQRYVLEDQRWYWQRSLDRFDTANRQVTRYRASFAFMAGLASAMVGLIVQTQFVGTGACDVLTNTTLPDYCSTLQLITNVLIMLAVVFPPFGVFFSTLADTFQWENQIPLFERSIENIEVADALSPDPEMDDDEYWASLRAYVEGTLAVMREETTRFEIQTKTPDELHAFIEQQRQIARRAGGDADAHRIRTADPD